MIAQSLRDLLERTLGDAGALAWLVEPDSGLWMWASAAARRAAALPDAVDHARSPATTDRDTDAGAHERQQSFALRAALAARGPILTRRITLGPATFELHVVHPVDDAGPQPATALLLRERSEPRYWSEQYGLPARLAEVAALLAQGATSATIAQSLVLTVQSARTYVKRTLARLPPAERASLTQRRLPPRPALVSDGPRGGE